VIVIVSISSGGWLGGRCEWGLSKVYLKSEMGVDCVEMECMLEKFGSVELGLPCCNG
jgi:hypothetical protein